MKKNQEIAREIKTQFVLFKLNKDQDIELDENIIDDLEENQ